MSAFPGLDPLAAGGTVVETAQRFLASAYDSVANLFENHYPLVRGQRDATRGRLTHAEQDIFRAAIVFAGAGLDATLKEITRQAVPIQVRRSEDARTKFREFGARYLSAAQGVDLKRLAELMIAPDHRIALLEAYVRHLTGSSLQSVEQVHETLSALGLGGRRELYRECTDLRPLFQARNQIAHELDLQAREKPGDRKRRERRITESQRLCHAGLNFSQRVINAIIEELGTHAGGYPIQIADDSLV